MTIGELETLINKARLVKHATGTELALHKEVAVLAGIYGRMIYAGVVETTQLQLSDKERLALLEVTS